MSTFSKIFAFFALLVIATPACAQQINVPQGGSWSANVTIVRGNGQVIVNAGGNPQTWGNCEQSNSLSTNISKSITLQPGSTITVKTGGMSPCPATVWTVVPAPQPTANTYTFNGSGGEQIIVTLVDGSVGHGGGGDDAPPPPSH